MSELKNQYQNVLCILQPKNKEARKIVRDLRHDNQRLVDPSDRIMISHDINPRRARRLLTFGRGRENVVVLKAEEYSYHQCEIIVHPKSAEILVHDLSTYGTTTLSVDGDVDGKYDFSKKGPRQRRVPRRQGIRLRMGQAEFAFIWSNDPEQEESVRKGLIAFANRVTDPSEEITRLEIRSHSPPSTAASASLPKKI